MLDRPNPATTAGHNPMNGAGYSATEAVPLNLDTMTAAALLTMRLPPREYAVAPILPQPGLAMIYAPRGMGKTFVALSFSYAIACGSPVFKWAAPRPRRVLHVDGEMPAGMLQRRLADIAQGADAAPPDDDYLRLAIGDLCDGGISNIAAPRGQDMLTRAAEKADVLLLDNLSTLASGMRENEADDWGGFQGWLLSMRRAGKLVILVHHAGKGGQQRGTSRREDALDTVIALRRPADYSPREGARFEVHVEKARGAMGPDVAPFEAVLQQAPGGGLAWATKDLDVAQRDRAVELLAENMSVRKVADATGMSKSAVQRLKDGKAP
jgi:putative DNA primase/helicase